MGYAFALIAVVCWGLVHIPIKLAKAPGRLGVMVAMPAAMIPLILLAVATGQFLIPDCSWRDWLFILLTGLCQFAFGEAAYYEAVHCAGITVAAPTTRLTPLLVVTATMFLTPEQFSWLLLPAAATIALGGILLARALRSRNTQPAHPDLKKGIIFALLACVAWAAGNLAVDQVDKDISRIMVTLLALGFEPGDLFYTDFTGGFSLWLSHAQLGLLRGDELNALDVKPPCVIPEPAGLGLIGLVALGLRRRRR